MSLSDRERAGAFEAFSFTDSVFRSERAGAFEAVSFTDSVFRSERAGAFWLFVVSSSPVVRIERFPTAKPRKRSGGFYTKPPNSGI
ncbi:hypothetical protein NGM10_13810 [Halorussus salilacus]|uniref:hypothetical protein n=1 Tax=Halorussus salilacus TaxID=2953750 RepID=UPI0020A06037|nr:hypothetical protein [Halorussus salilacus]USZ67797.1 hypothetical protein NGM10_13810 [Halorussus salilacus]